MPDHYHNFIIIVFLCLEQKRRTGYIITYAYKVIVNDDVVEMKADSYVHRD